MKRVKCFWMVLMVVALVGIFAACAAKSYALTGDGITFLVDGKSVSTAAEGQEVGISYEEQFGYSYTLSAVSGENSITIEDNVFVMPGGDVRVTLAREAILYPVQAPASVTFTSGTNEGKVTVESIVSFTVDVPAEEVLSSVTVNDNPLEAENGTFVFAAGDYLSESAPQIIIAVNTAERTYPLTAPASVRFTEGVSGGMVRNDTRVSFTVQPEQGKHIIAVKVNGDVIEGKDGVYSFSSADYIAGPESVIAVTVESEAHTYDPQTVQPTCAEGGYTVYTCSVCGDSYTDDYTEARFLLADMSKWQADAMLLENVSGGVKITQNRNDIWNYNFRYVEIDIQTDKYFLIDFDGMTASAFAVQFSETADECKQIFTQGGRYVIPLSEMGITTSGTYGLNIYLEGAQNSIAYVRDLTFLSAQDETIHRYKETSRVEATCHGSGEIDYECEVCGRMHIESIEARFLFADPEKWMSGIQLDYRNYAAVFIMTTEDGRSVAYRKIALAPEQYLYFGGTGKFKVAICKEGEETENVVVAEQEFNGNTVRVPLESAVEEEGTYLLRVYVVGAKDSVHTVSECSILNSESEEIHSFGNWEEDENGKSRTCAVCGKVDRVDKIAVIFSVDGKNETVKVYPGEKAERPADPSKQGYDFAGWYCNDNLFDFESPVTEQITLIARFTPKTDTAYKIEYYEQQADGTYRLVSTAEMKGTTDAKVEAGAYTPENENLLPDLSHEDSLTEGIVAADGSLVLRVYYSAEKVTAYDLSGMRGAESVKAVFEAGTIEDGTMVMMELRDGNNAVQHRLYARANGSVAEFDTSGLDLRGYKAVVAAESDGAEVSSLSTQAAIVAKADIGKALASSTIRVDNIDIYGPQAKDLTEDGGVLANGATSIEVFYAGEFDYATVEMSGISYCGSGGDDSVFLQSGGETLGTLNFKGSGIYYFGAERSVTVTFTKEEYKSGIRLLIYKYCAKDWSECKTHPQEWVRGGEIVFYQANNAAETTIYAVNGVGAEYVAPSGQLFVRADGLAAGTVTATFAGAESGDAAMLAVCDESGNTLATYYAQVSEDKTAVFAVEERSDTVLLAGVTSTGVSADAFRAEGAASVESLGKALYDSSVTSVVTTYYARPSLSLTQEGDIVTTESAMYRQNYWVSDGAKPLNGYDYSFVYNGDLSNVTSITLDYSFKKICNCGGGDWFWITNGSQVVGHFSCQDKANATYEGTIKIEGDKLALCTSDTFHIFYGFGCSLKNAAHVGETLTFGELKFNLNYELAETVVMDVSAQIEYVPQEGQE